jgi:tetratricopeptide (TPR) repeat protein
MPRRLVSPTELQITEDKMQPFTSNTRARFVAAIVSVFCLLSLAASMRGQEQPTQLPAKNGYVTDSAGVFDAAMKERLEAILKNFKERTDIEFVIATVKTIGSEDVYEYSLRLAKAWDVGVRNSRHKSMLLVVSEDQAKFFTQFSRVAQEDLPEGSVGELIIHMRPKLQKSDFNGGVFDGVKSFVSLLGERKNFKFDELDQRGAETIAADSTRPRTVSAGEAIPEASPAPSETPQVIAPATPAPENRETASQPSPAATESPVAKAETSASPTPAPSESPSAAPTPGPTETPTPSVETQPQPAATTSPAATETKAPPARETPSPNPANSSPQPAETPAPPSAAPVENPTPQPVPTNATEPAVNVAANKSTDPGPKKGIPTSAKRSSSSSANTPANPDDEKEEVELTLTLPVDKRIDTLKAFISAHPKSAAVARANELIVVAHATLGDQKLQAADISGGLQEFRAALNEAPPDMTDRLFAEVIANIPMNLFVRNQRAAAIDFARQVEALAKLNPKRLLAIEQFYLNTENVGEANRLAELVAQQAPEMAAAHQALGAARHIDLRLEEAEKEYARALELDPRSVNARRSLADLKRAAGKYDEALSLYQELLGGNANDRSAFAGMVVSLLETGKKEDAARALDAALKEKGQSQNFALLAGAAYWFAAHNDAARALELAQAAVEIEPRYSWSQIALARALVANKRPVEAERAVRFARQFGRFPTLDYELASVLASLGLYDEAARELTRSFSLKDGQIETKLAGRSVARATNFTELLAPERRAAIFQSTAADSENNAKMLKGLLAFSMLLNAPDSQSIKEDAVITAANDFLSGTDAMRVYRQIYVAGKLINKGVALDHVLELMDAATAGVEAALDVPAATIAVQPDELSDTRARALAQGGTPDVPDAPRAALSGLLRGRIEDLTGLALFNQDKANAAVEHLRRAVSVAPQGTPLWRATLWHLGSALEASGKNDQALLYYIKYYVSGKPDPVRRSVIENVYKKVNGTLDGLDDKIGPGTASPPTPAPSPSSKSVGA